MIRSLLLGSFVIAGLVALVGCGSPAGGSPSGPGPAVDVAPGVDVPQLADPPPSTDVSRLVAGNTAFAAELYGRLGQQPGNVFFSPLSVSTALAMTSAGAGGDTLAEMNKTLHLPADAHTAFGALLAAVNGDGKARAYELTMANALWGAQGSPWRPEFLALARQRYGASVSAVDFAQPDAVRQINDWVAAATQQRIRELIGAGSLDANTGLVLTNAIYFKGKWHSQFKERATRDEPFIHADGTKTNVPLMRQVGIFAYHGDARRQVLKMPYAGEELSLMIVLPRAVDGLPEIEKSLTAEVIAGWSKAVRPAEVSVFLPRFKAETQYPLGEPLAALGMRACFNGAAADLSGIYQSDGPLFISLAIHRAFVEVNEEGTEAAAATAIEVMKTPAQEEREPQPVVFRADHPFLFLIRHNATRSILFLGRYAGPK